MAENTPDSAADLIALAGDITIAWLQNPNVHPGAQDVPAFLKSMHAAITELGSDGAPEPEAPTYEPAVSVRSSVKPDHLVSLIDGKKYKTLKRHLAINGLTPDEYRARYGLKPDYPMVAESYATQRREIAQKLGLGRKPAAPSDAPDLAPVDAVTETPVTAPARPKRAKAETAKATAPAPSKAKPAASTASKTVEEAATASEPDTASEAPKPTRNARKAKVQAEPDAVTTPEVVTDKKPAAKSKRMARRPAADAPAEVDAVPTATLEAETAAKPKRAVAKPKAATAKTAETSAKPARVKKAKADAPVEVPAEPNQPEPSEA